MSRFRVIDTPLRDLKVVERSRVGDARGYLSRLFCADELASAGWSGRVAQVNHTLTRREGTVRGLHFQHPPDAELKLVSCLRGEVWDVAVDLRRGSATFLQWFGRHLTGDNGQALLIPQGFAHGFQTLCDDCELIYLHSEAYAPHSEAAVHPQDPRVAIRWPRAISDMSMRDRSHPWLAADFEGIPI